jgi:hypothetical protein
MPEPVVVLAVGSLVYNPVAVTYVSLVARADVPIQTLVPLKRIVVRWRIDDVVVVRFSAIRVG